MLCYQLQLLKIISAARWLEQTAIGHTIFFNVGHVLHTHTHLTNFKNLMSSKHIYMEKMYKKYYCHNVFLLEVKKNYFNKLALEKY